MRRLSIAAAVGVIAAFATGPGAAQTASCPKANTLGVSRTVEIDTTGGPGFGFEHYKAIDFLQPKEVVLTFDDGPQKFSTELVLAALAEQCTKATFFSIGKMALGYPEIIREVAKAGHTIGTHTWSHQPIGKLKTFEEGKAEIERGISAVRRAAGVPIAPFFRFPTLKDTPEAVAHLGKRNIAMFSTDIDSFDFKPQPAENIAKSVVEKLEKNGKGIVLMHDIHKTTAKAVPLLLAALKEKGFKIVHLKAKAEVTTLAEFDASIEKDAKGLPQAGAERPASSVVKTIEGTPTAEEQAKAAAPAEAATAAAAQADMPPAAPPAQPATPAVATSAAPDTTAAAQPQAAASPVTTIPTVANAASSIASEPSSGNSKAADAAPAGTGKSMTDKAKEIWQLWFGK
jgi:peptidoglycan-N-acetylglucosamine deacetylase